MRAAIVGSGGIARVHATLIEQLGGTVVAVCGRTLAGAASLGRGQAYDDLTALLRAERPDVVHVCSPNYLHAEHAILALEAGAHTVCEKPLATTRDEALRMVEAAQRSGRVAAVCYTYRGYPLIQELRLAVAAGHYGRLRRVSGEYLSQDLADAEKYAWHFTRGMAGPAFVLLDYGTHWLDLVEHVTGQRIVEIVSQVSTHQRRRFWHGRPGEGPRPGHGEALADGRVAVDVELEDHADILLRLDGGAAGAASITALSIGNPNHIVLSVDGEKGGFDWCQETADTFVERRPNEKALRHRDPERLPPELGWISSLPAGHPEGYLDAFRNVIGSAWRAMRGETVLYPTFEDGCRGNALVDAAIESAKTRRPVEPKD